MKNALILLAGGSGKRLGNKEPKQFIKIGNTSLIEYFLSSLDCKIFDIVVIATKNSDKKKYLRNIKKKFIKHNIVYSNSGKTRQISSKNSLNYLKKYNPVNVLIHDCARPLVSNTLMNKILRSLKKNISCVPYFKSNDLIKINNEYNSKNKNIINLQTPQGFKFKVILEAHKNSKKINAKDDSILLENSGFKVKMIKGEIANIKITRKEDLDYFNKIRLREYRSGIGYDIHQIDFNSKNKLILCGVKIKHPALIGHSDADVGYHAICDSILGSLSLRDIGYFFNNKNKKWKNANSKIFIQFCAEKLSQEGYKIINLDVNFICETPKIGSLITSMKKNISSLLNIKMNQISIKATTNEKIGLIGRGEGIAAEAIVQIVNV